MEAELRVLPVDGRRNPEPTATLILHLQISDARANAELALHNLVRSLSKRPPAKEIGDKADALAVEGKNAIRESSDLAGAFEGAIPSIDHFVTVVDKVADVRTFNWVSIASISDQLCNA